MPCTQLECLECSPVKSSARSTHVMHVINGALMRLVDYTPILVNGDSLGSPGW